MAPAVDFDGKIYLEKKDTPALSPNGNGGWFASMKRAGLCEDGVTRKPEKENGKKFETLAVDLIKLMGSVLPYEVVREKEFAPIKNKTGVDSVESARELLKLNGVEL